MELSLLPYRHHSRLLLGSCPGAVHSSDKFAAGSLPPKKRVTSVPSSSCRCSKESHSLAKGSIGESSRVVEADGRRWFLGILLASAAGLSSCDEANAVSSSRRALRAAKIPESEYTTLPNGLKYYDIKVGGGPKAVKGSRVAV